MNQFGVVYYTDNKLDKVIMSACQRQILKSVLEDRIISVSLRPIRFGINYIMNLERGYLTMFKQILFGLEMSTADIVFLCEHDILYDKSHFDFVPISPTVFYYNTNVWKVRIEDDHSLFCNDVKQTSGLCAYRSLLVGHYRRRIAKLLRNQADCIENGLAVVNDGFSRHMGFEPGCHSIPRGVDNYKAESWMSSSPNIDIRHDSNLTKNRWSKDQFRDKKYTDGWTESEYVPGWGKLSDVLKELSL